MKRVIATIVGVALLVALGAVALAEHPAYMYCTQDDTPVYATKYRYSNVVSTFDRGDLVEIEDVSLSGNWYSVYYEKRGKTKVGWVEAIYLSETKPCDHKWGEWQVYRQATCTETGLRIRTCSICGASEAADIDKLPHSFGKWRVVKEATCTREGLQARECKVCGEEEEKKLEKLSHDFGEWEVVKEATCTEKGERVRECKECGYEDEQEIDKLPHEYGEWKVVIDATDHSAGTRRRTCIVCGHGESEQFDPEGTLRRGSRGDAVREIQQLLSDQGYLKGSGVDGIFGPGVERAIIQFQTDQGLMPDGVAWPQTIRLMHHEYGPWRTVKMLTRDTDGERARTCVDCGYEQREIVKAGVTFERRARGEDIRTLQNMLNDLGFAAGTADGIYGQKLDSAYDQFSAENELDDFELGRITPLDVDALVNAWIADELDKNWMGRGDEDTPVRLVLRVKASDGTQPTDDMLVFDWTLTNQGRQACRFDALLLNYHGGTDFTGNNLVMVLDGATLRANGGNTLSGSFSVSRDWGDGKLHFAAIATSEKTGGIWLSNTRRYATE